MARGRPTTATVSPREKMVGDRECSPIAIRPETLADRDAIRPLTAREFAKPSFSDATEGRLRTDVGECVRPDLMRDAIRRGRNPR